MTIARRIGLRGICSEGRPLKRILNLIFFTIDTLSRPSELIRVNGPKPCIRLLKYSGACERVSWVGKRGFWR